MRTATFVLVAYVLCIVVGALWRLLPGPLAAAVPDLGALTAAYLGLTVRRNITHALAGSIAVGYLRDVITGAPTGFFTLVLAITCLIARAVQQRLYVRGAAMTMAFSGFIAVASAVIAMAVRSGFHIPGPALSVAISDLARTATATALAGPVLWGLFRRIDAAYARTHRDRDAVLEGLGRS